MKGILDRISLLFFIAMIFCCFCNNALSEKRHIDLREIDSDECAISFTAMKGQTRFDIISYVNVHDYNQMIGVAWLFSDLARALFKLDWINITSKTRGLSPYIVLVEYKRRNNDIGSRAIYVSFALENEQLIAEYITNEWLSEDTALNVVDRAVSKIVQQMNISHAADNVFRNIRKAEKNKLE